LSGKRVYDTYYDGGKSRQNSKPKKNKVVVGELQTKFQTPDGWFTRCYKMWITCGKLFCGGGCG